MDFQGVIIAESLEDTTLLDTLNITATTVEVVTEKHKTPWVKQWTLHTISIPEDDAETTANLLSNALDDRHSWYADYKNSSEHFIIFPHKVFHITDRADKTQYSEATEYGVSIGIPDYQVDFSPHVKQWSR